MRTLRRTALTADDFTPEEDSDRALLEAVEYAFDFVQARSAMRARA